MAGAGPSLDAIRNTTPEGGKKGYSRGVSDFPLSTRLYGAASLSLFLVPGFTEPVVERLGSSGRASPRCAKGMHRY